MKLLKRPLQTFSITFFLFVVAFALHDLHPFGNKQIMIIDSWHQYYPILKQLHYKLTHGGSLFYALNTGAGTNFYLMLSYYAMSPLNLLSIVVPHAYIRDFLAFITIFKIALGAGFFTMYLQSTYKKQDLSIVAFGIIYGFSGFILGYYWNVMWLDVVMLTPLTILGLYRIIYNKSPKVYVITLALALISNFYAAYFLCLFIAFYTLVVSITKPEFNFKHMVKDALKVLGYSVISIMIASVVIVPVYFGMQSAYALASKDPTEVELYHTLFDIFTRFGSFIEPTSIDGMPNLSIGAFALILSLFYFAQTKITLRERTANGILLIFLLLSTTVNYLDFLWHAFHFPNQVPHRFTFVICFLMINMAYQAFLILNSDNIKTVTKITVHIAIFFMAAEYFSEETLISLAFIGTAISLAIYAFILNAYVHYQERSKIILVGLLGLICVESLLSLFIGIDYNRVSTYSGYPAKESSIASAIDYIRLNDKGVYRIETTPYYSANDPLLYNYMGVSQFSSTANAGFNGFTEALGLSSSPGSNSYKYLPNTPVVNGFLNLKYLIDKDQRLVNSPVYTTIKQTDDVAILENNYAFPFGFASRFDIYTYDDSSSSPFQRQEALMTKVTGINKTLFEPIDSLQISASNIEGESISGIAHNYKNINASREGKAEMQVTFPRDGQVYAYVKNSHKTMNVSYPNDKTHKYDPRKGVVVDLGYVRAGQSATFNINLKAQASGYYDFEVVYFDQVAFEQQYAEIIRQPLDITIFEEGHIEGNITMQDNEPLYLAMPFDEGWTVKVDGEKSELDTINEGVSMILLSAGYHNIKMTYVPAGFRLGVLVSVIGVGLFVGICLYLKRKGHYSVN